MSPPLRRILHVDMDAFYASVEQRDDPTLKGKPVAVGGEASRRGVIAAASYEARAFGVRSAIPTARAMRLCPSLVLLRPDFPRYKAASEAVFRLFREVTPFVEPLSLDEAYLDVTENAWGETLGVAVAKRLKRRIWEVTELTASAGVAPNKFLAKIASGWKKPDGLTVIAPERVQAFLEKLPVDALWGVGPVTAERLRAIGIQRLVDVRNVADDVLQRAVGSHGAFLKELAEGRDDRPVVPDRPTKSAGCENTYAEDLQDLAVARDEIDRMGRRVAGFLEKRGLLARTVTLKVRYSNFDLITRSDTQDPATRDAEALVARALALVAKTEMPTRPVRLLGVSAHGLMEDGVAAREDGTVDGRDDSIAPPRARRTRDRFDEAQLDLPLDGEPAGSTPGSRV